MYTAIAYIRKILETILSIVIKMIIFLNGSINAGKSTVAKILAKKIPNTANVEIDRLRDFVEWLDI